MNIVEISEHTIDLDLLPQKATILDGGCRIFTFTDPLFAMGHNVFSVDIDNLVDNKYFHCALSDKSGKCAVVRTNDPQATHIKEGEEIPMYTIVDFSEMVGVEKWDLIKLDIEGKEFDILHNSQHPLATQLTVEFHSHCDKRQTKEALDLLIEKLSEFYTVHNQKWEEKYCCAPNYWDVLFIAK